MGHWEHFNTDLKLGEIREILIFLCVIMVM